MRDRGTWQDIVERGLVMACRSVLARDDAVGYAPDQVSYEYRGFDDAIDVRVRFRLGRGARALFERVVLSALDLHDVPSRIVQAFCEQSIYRIWSREYENHHMRQAERRAHEALSMARTPEELRMRAEQWNYLRTHVERFHTDDVVPLVRDAATATEISERQREFGRRLDEQMVRAFLGADREAVTATAEASEATPEGEGLSIERLLEAVRMLDEARVPQPNYRAVLNLISPQQLCNEWLDTYGGAFLRPGVGTPEAQERGMRLLRENLTPEQLASYEANKHFDVVGGKSGKTYRIHHGRQMNIRELHPTGEPKCGWCFLPQGALVEGDVMLGQKIALELFEDEALAIANRF